MGRPEPRGRDFSIGSGYVPDDVRAELDAEERRMHAEANLAASTDAAPEDVLSELDRESRLGHEEVR